MARFFGSTPGSSRSDSYQGDIFHEEIIGNMQQSEVAMTLCSEVKADVKNLQNEMDVLKGMVANLCEKAEETSTNAKGKRQRVPAGLFGKC